MKESLETVDATLGIEKEPLGVVGDSRDNREGLLGIVTELLDAIRASLEFITEFFQEFFKSIVGILGVVEESLGFTEESFEDMAGPLGAVTELLGVVLGVRGLSMNAALIISEEVKTKTFYIRKKQISLN